MSRTSVRRTNARRSDNADDCLLTADVTRHKSSYEGHTVDALAPRAEEGRGKLRKVMGSRKQALIHESPNGETQRW